MLRLTAVGAASLLLLACSSAETGAGSGAAAAAGGSSAGGASAGGSSAGGSSAGGSSAGGASAGGASAGGASAGGASAGGAGGSSTTTVTASLSEGSFSLNCQPITGPDPMSGSFKVTYDNSLGESLATATLTAVKLVLSKTGQQLEGQLQVTPTTVMVDASSSKAQSHTKVTATATYTGTGDPCDYCTEPWALELTWNVDGQIMNPLSSSGTLNCVH